MATYNNAKVVGGSLNIRKTPSTDATRMGSFSSGTLITVDDYSANDAWLRISSGTYSGYYVMRKYVDVSWCTNRDETLLFGSATLSSGSSGKYVYNLQHALNRFYNEIGHAFLDVDGSFGPLTKQAVKDFQGSYSTSVDGVFGYFTRWRLTTYLGQI